MGIEKARSQEILSPGQLYFLSHPGSELFSGYGLTTQQGRKDRLTGLLMVDRPHPADPRWLAEIEARYGDYQLVAMTQTGERGMLAQMHIAAESEPLLERYSHPIAHEFQRALKPLLDAPPAPVLKLRWDEEQRLWRSEFWIGLPPTLQDVFAEMGPGCLAVERDDGQVAFVSHARDHDIARFRHAPVQWRWQLIEMPTAPLIRFRAAILDDPVAPYVYEHFLNVADSEQAHCLAQLVKQEELTLDFFGDEYEYAFSKKLAHAAEKRADLQAIVRRAVDHYGAIPAPQRDFDRAKAVFQRYFPM